MTDAQPQCHGSVRELQCLAGLDEAGLGPILGPLVVAGAAMSGPVGTDPWQGLRNAVSRRKFESGKVRVADSKKVHSGVRGMLHLERTALSFLTVATGSMPATLQAILEAQGHDLAMLQRCPWYEDLGLALPRRADPGEVELMAHGIERALQQSDMTLRQITARVIDVEEFNAGIATTDNKSRTHFQAFGSVLERLLKALPAGAHVVADRCGGIMHYTPSLRRSYPSASIVTLAESPNVSTYDVGTDHGAIRVTFSVQGEERAFPTALASCVAKYLRELMIELLNRWFTARVPGLAPTAGYYQDGLRFLSDVGAIVGAPDFPRSRLIRVR